MGDAGSLFLGFLLAVLATRIELVDSPPLVALFVPLLVLGVALFDTTLVVIERLLHGRSPFQGGRDHASHRLVFLGLPVPVSVGLIYGTAIALAWLALLLRQLPTEPGLMLVAFVLTAGVALLLLLSPWSSRLVRTSPSPGRHGRTGAGRSCRCSSPCWPPAWACSCSPSPRSSARPPSSSGPRRAAPPSRRCSRCCPTGRSTCA